jgi:hypothetical protein
MSHYRNNNTGSSNNQNERQFLLNILNKMYNDNVRQINYLSQGNNQIRNMLYNLYDDNNRTNQNNNNRNTNTLRNYSRENPNTSRNITSQTTNTNTTNSLGRIYLNDIPYIIDSYQEYYIPNNHNLLARYSRNNPNLSERRYSRNNSTLFGRATGNTNDNQPNNFFDPVEVFPTASQIEIATRCVRYCDIVSPRNIQCPISLENFNDNDIVTVIRHCGHIFKTEQLNTWFRSNCRCPICRYDVRTYNSNSSPQSSNEEQTDEQPTSNNVSNNFTQQNLFGQTNEERNNNTFDTFLNVLNSTLSTTNPDQLLGMLDGSANLIYDSSDPNAIRNLVNVLNRWYPYN